MVSDETVTSRMTDQDVAELERAVHLVATMWGRISGNPEYVFEVTRSTTMKRVKMSASWSSVTRPQFPFRLTIR